MMNVTSRDIHYIINYFQSLINIFDILNADDIFTIQFFHLTSPLM